ncbi:MAG: FixH family protein [Nitrospirae bacterium]|nr:FixH family protein [Nitrospirota bacterium]MCL5977421.1 FixH family protein [Nitrospirota bacterium]
MMYKTLIGLVMLAGMGVIALSIVVGVSHRDAVVEDDPYEAGLRFDRTLKRQMELGWKLKVPPFVREGNNRLVASISDRDGRAVDVAAVELLVSRMGSPRIDRYNALNIGNGRYQAAVVFNGTGYWEVKARVIAVSDTIVFDNKVYVEK